MIAAIVELTISGFLSLNFLNETTLEPRSLASGLTFIKQTP
jgi:hypothetical protein